MGAHVRITLRGMPEVETTAARHGLDMLKGNARGEFDGLEASGGDINHREIGVDPVDHLLPRQRVGARLYEFGFSGLGGVLGEDENFFTPATKSMAPPTAGMAPGFPVDQLARSPD